MVGWYEKLGENLISILVNTAMSKLLKKISFQAKLYLGMCILLKYQQTRFQHGPKNNNMK